MPPIRRRRGIQGNFGLGWSALLVSLLTGFNYGIRKCVWAQFSQRVADSGP